MKEKLKKGFVRESSGTPVFYQPKSLDSTFDLSWNYFASILDIKEAKRPKGLEKPLVCSALTIHNQKLYLSYNYTTAPQYKTLVKDILSDLHALVSTKALPYLPSVYNVLLNNTSTALSYALKKVLEDASFWAKYLPGTNLQFMQQSNVENFLIFSPI